MFSIYAKLSIQSIACSKERERVASHMQGTVLTSAGLKILPTIKNLYPVPFFYELSTLVGIKLQHPLHDSY